MTGTPLRDLVEERVGLRWSRFAEEHPNLAASIDRVRLVESAVSALREDEAFAAALRAADLDEARLVSAARALERLEGVVGLVLRR